MHPFKKEGEPLRLAPSLDVEEEGLGKRLEELTC